MTEHRIMIRFGILIISDRSATGERMDKSGPALSNQIQNNNWCVVGQEIVPDEFELIAAKLSDWADSGNFDIIITTGGTGLSPRDITPEATLSVIERLAPGFCEAMRFSSLQVTPHAMLSRSVAGIRKKTVIINLPGSPKGAVDNLQTIIPVLPHAVQLLSEDPEAEAGHDFPA